MPQSTCNLSQLHYSHTDIPPQGQDHSGAMQNSWSLTTAMKVVRCLPTKFGIYGHPFMSETLW